MKDTTVNLEYFKIIDSNNKAYLLGFIAADGALVKGVNTSSTTLTLTIHRKDKIILDLLKRELNSSFSNKRYYK